LITDEISYNNLKNNDQLLDFLILSSLSLSYEKKIRNIVNAINRKYKLNLSAQEKQSISKIIFFRIQIFIDQGIVEKNEYGYFLKRYFDVNYIYNSSAITIK